MASSVAQKQNSKADLMALLSTTSLSRVNANPGEYAQVNRDAGTDPRMASVNDNLTLKSGIIKAAQTYFKYQETGIKGSIGRAYFGGAFYTSPDAFVKDMTQKAEHNPEMANFLRESASDTKMTDQDYFEKLQKFYK